MRCMQVASAHGQEDVRLQAVVDDGDPANKSFALYTPAASVQISISNPAAQGAFVEGELYYVDFVPCEMAGSAPAEKIAPVVETKAHRAVIRDQVESLNKSSRRSRSRSLAITKLEEASMWLGKDLQELNEPTPYPTSHDPAVPGIDATAPEACKLPGA